jgi:hypothetical protein
VFITQNGSPRADIVLAPNAPWLVRHAAEELSTYIERISGAELGVSGRCPDTGSCILLGSVSDTGHDEPVGDEFIVRTSLTNGQEALILSGGTDRATLWAVYAFLEDVLGIGFFRDGEQIPERPTIEVTDLAIHEKPRFRERGDGNGCIYHYSTSWWDWDDWRRELDWNAKRRVTQYYAPLVGAGVMVDLNRKWGISDEIKHPGQAPEDETLNLRIFEYARKLGMRFAMSLPTATMPQQFFDDNPEVRRLVVQWSELPPFTMIHPSDPMFKRFHADFIDLYSLRYGNDHLYLAEFASESTILEGADDKHEPRLVFARAISDALLAADPIAEWIPSTWSFDFEPSEFGSMVAGESSPEEVRQFLDTIEVPCVIHDLWAEEAAKYQHCEHFFGNPWGFGVLHSMGWGGYMHGDVRELVNQVHAVSSEPASNCIDFLVESELIDHNPFYYELCSKLSWSPLDIDVESFVADYCAHRYGEPGESLIPAYNLLIETVYGPDCGTINIPLDQMYMMRPDLELDNGWPRYREQRDALRAVRPSWLPKLYQAITIFLAQPDLLSSNEMAVRDLIDITRHYLAERFNIALIAGRDAFLAGDGESLERNAGECRQILVDQARLLSGWPAYRLNRKIELERKNWGDDACRAIKHTHVWVTYAETEHSPPLRDYYRQDLDGLVADYYAVRVDAYFDLLHSKLEHGVTTVDDGEFEALYAPIEAEFVASPVRSLPQSDPVETAREIAARWAVEDV